MINLLKIARKLDQKGQYKLADKLTKRASILLMAIQFKQDLEDGIRALYNYFDERTLTRLLKQTNILERDGDISSRPFDYNELMNGLNNLETTSPADLPTQSGNNNYNNLDWLLKGKLDKPVYISCKINGKDAFEKEIKDAVFLYHKNGFYFYKRNPLP